MKKSTGAEKQSVPVEEQAQQPTRWERFLAYLLGFDRFGSDLLGMMLCASGALTLLGLLGLTSGAIIEPWSRFLAGWFGFGSYVLAALMIVLGVVIIRRRSARLLPFKLGRILQAEVLFFALLALLALAGGASLERAQLGLDGGKIGWGLARVSTLLFSPSLALVGWLILVFVLLSALLGVGRRLVAWLDAKLLSEEDRQKVIAVEMSVAAQAMPEESLPPVLETPKPGRDERLPPLNLLARELTPQVDEQRIIEIGQQIEVTLEEFGLPARVVGYRVGPTVTQFAVEPGFIERPGPDGKPQLQKVRVAQISALARDLALSLSAERVRIEAPVPGQSYVGIEIPNSHHTLVLLRPLLE
jgi:S-DNA-T family DNA segregation ATPase FtsK/SpoIIIE